MGCCRRRRRRRRLFLVLLAVLCFATHTRGGDSALVFCFLSTPSSVLGHKMEKTRV
jgi:hypothetical protein